MANAPARRQDTPAASTALVARIDRPANLPAEITPENWQILTDVVWPGAKDPNVIVTAFNYCKARRLDPFKRPVHIVPSYSSALRKTVETIWPGIGELETTAARSGVWAGMDPPVWGPMQQRRFTGTKREYNSDRDVAVSVDMEFPDSCAVTVYRLVKGEKVAFTEPVFWIEAYGRAGFGSEMPNDRWQKAPRQMLQKCAKAAALRAAFPEDIGNDYTAEEMEGQTIEGRGRVIEHDEPERQQRPAEKVQTFPLGSAPGSGIEPDTRPQREKNLDARDEINRATAQPQQEKAAPQRNAAPPPQGNPEYPITTTTGEVQAWYTGTEYLQWIRDELRAIGNKPNVIRIFADKQKEHLAEIAEFDPSAAVDAGEFIELAMKGAAA